MGARKLTAKAVDNAKPGTSRREIADGLVPGLYLVVHPSGNKAWALRYRMGDKPKKLTLGRYPALELPDARTSAKEALAAVEKGDDPGTAKQADKAARRDTFERVVEQFIEKHAKRHNRTWRQQKQILNTHVVPKWRDRPIASITRRDVIELVEGIADRGRPYMANRVLATVRKLLNWAVERDIIRESPAAGVKAPASEHSRDRVLDDGEIAALWTAFDAEGQPAGDMFKVLLLTAQRRSEVAEMRWADLDLDEGTWTIPAESTKTAKAHVVPLPAPALEIIRAQPRMAHGDYVFPGRSGRTPFNGISKAKARVDERAGTSDWRVHDLRRTAASGMARMNVAPHVVEAVLNHTSGSFGGVAGVYQRHRYDNEKRHALETWAAHVMRTVGAEGQPDNVVSLGAAG